MPDSLIHWLPMILAVIAAAVAGGIVAGLLGVGGGLILVPALDLAFSSAGIERELSLHMAVATSMATIIPTAISSSRSHAKRGAVDATIIRQWSVPIVVGALFGSLAAGRMDSRVLAGVFAVVALLAALKMLLPLDNKVLRSGLPTGLPGALIPAFIGGISALMGIGGGTLSVPAMTLCGESVHKAVGTAALLGLWIALPATVGYLLGQPPAGLERPPLTVGFVSLLGFALVGPITWFVAPFGAHLAHKLDRRKLSMAFGAFLVTVAARMFHRVLS